VVIFFEKKGHGFLKTPLKSCILSFEKKKQLYSRNFAKHGKFFKSHWQNADCLSYQADLSG
jgi:hypothetical protein